MTDRNRIDRPGLDDLSLSRAQRKALRNDDATEPVVSGDEAHVPKPALASEIADREGTAEWAGDDEQVDLPGPDQYSFGATQNPVANSGVSDFILKYQGDGVVSDGPLDELPADEGSTDGGSEGPGVQAGSDYLLKFSHVGVEDFQAIPDMDANPEAQSLKEVFITSLTDGPDAEAQSLKEVFITSIMSPRDIASGQVTDAHDRYANQEVSYVQSDDAGDALLPFVEQQSFVAEPEISGYAALDGEIDL